MSMFKAFQKSLKHSCLLLLFSLVITLAKSQAFIDYSRFLGGNSTETSYGLVVDGGYTYVWGSSSAAGLPVVNGRNYAGGADFYVAKMDASNTIVFSTYFGGSGFESITGQLRRGLIVSGNDIYLAGETGSTDLPVTNGSSSAGSFDLFLTKINTITGSISFCTYYGGAGTEYFEDFKLSGGDIYLMANAGNGFPVTTGLLYGGGTNDQGVIRFNGNTGTAVWATTVGGAGDDGFLNGRLVVSGSRVYIASSTFSSRVDLPATDGSIGFVASLGLPTDVYVAGLDISNGNRSFLSYLAGGSFDTFTSMTESGGDLYISGTTISTNFRTTDGSVSSGGPKAFIAKYSSGGVLQFSKLITGTYTTCQLSKDIVASGGNIYLVGVADDGFPVTNGSSSAGDNDFIVTKFSSAGNLLFSSYVGAPASDFLASASLKVDCNDKIYLAARSSSGYPTTNGTTITGADDIVITRFNPATGQIEFSTFIGGIGQEDVLGFDIDGNRLKIFGHTQSYNYPVTVNPNSLNDFSDFIYTVLNVCPTGYTGSTAVSPVSQTVCQGGVVSQIAMATATIPGASLPTIYRNGTASQQVDLNAILYQWQEANAPAGPWTNITGAVGQNYIPPASTTNKYYRRLTYSSCCGVLTLEQTGDVSAVIVNSDGAPVVDAGGMFVTCPGSPVTIGGTPTATPQGGASIVSYLWTPAGSYVPNNTVSNPIVSPVTNTIYTVTVVDDRGCQQIGQAIVNVVTANAGPDVSNCGINPVRIGAAPPTGVTGITYSWTASPADPTMSCTNCAQPTVNPTVPTTYTLTQTLNITGGGTCVTNDDVVVTPVAGPTNNGGNFAGNDLTICNSSNGTLGTGAEAGFSYAWTPGNYLNATTTATTVFQPGSLSLPNPNPLTYYLTASRLGCSFVDSVRANTIKADAGQDVCGPTFIGVGDLMPALSETYSWTKITLGAGTADFTGATNLARVPVSAASVATTFRLTVTLNGVSCTDDVVVNPCGCVLPTITVQAANACASYALNGGTVTLTAFSPIPSTFTWSPAAGLSSATGAVVTLTDNVPRTYTVTATSIIDPSYFCSATIDVNQPTWALPAFTAQDVTSCPGTAVNIGQAPVAGYSYLWSSPLVDNPTSSNPLATAYSNASIPVVVTDAVSGCVTRDTATVTIAGLPSNPAGDDEIICGAATGIQLGTTPMAGVTYSWTSTPLGAVFNPNNTVANPTVDVAATTTFHVVATNSAVGCVLADDVTITVRNPAPNFTLPNQTYCPSVAGAIALPAGPGGMSSYSWAPFPLVLSPFSNGPTATTLSTRPSVPTVYTLTVTNADGCVSSASTTFTPVVSLPNAGPDQVICLSAGAVSIGDPANPTGGGISYSWSPGTGLSSTTDPNPIFTPTTAGVYNFTLTKTEAGCSTTDQVRITVNDITIPSVSIPTLCQAACTTIPIAPQTGVTYSWSPVTGLSNPTIANPVACPSTTTVYTLTAVSVNGCVSSRQITVSVAALPAPTVSIPNISACMGAGAIQLNPVVNPAGTYDYLWSPNDGTLTNIYASTPSAIIGATGLKTYTLLVVNPSNGCNGTGSVQVQTNICTVLPTKLQSFTGRIEDARTKLNWEVRDYNELQYSEVLYSTNGTVFTSLGIVKASGSSYQFTHERPATGANYYQIKLVDGNGKTIYSKVLLLKMSNSIQTNTLSIYPVPATDVLTIKARKGLGSNTILDIYDLEGRQIRSIKLSSLEPGKVLDVNISNLKSGLYLLSVRDSKGEKMIGKFIKQ